MALLQPDDIIWVHDYLIPLASELRALRQNRMGFPHIPRCRSRCWLLFRSTMAGARHVCL
jgi:trehalose-6-phosphate synthase